MLRLKELLKEKGISGKKLAERLSVSENTISFIANGKQQPRFELLKNIADILEVDIRELFKSTRDEELEPIYKRDENGELVIIGYLKKE